MTVAHDVCHVGIVLIPGFSLMAFASTVEPLRSANLMAGKTLYRWTYLSTGGAKVSSSGGLEVITSRLPSGEADVDIIVVCGGLGCETYRNDRLLAFLRAQSRRGTLVGAVSTASFILARAGLLKDRRCTVHWDYLEAFREAFGELEALEELFVVDRGVFTCAGGTAAMDMMLHLIRTRQGNGLAAMVSDQFIHGRVRQPADRQRMSMRNRLGVAQPMIVKAIEAMERSSEGELDLMKVAEGLDISSRQLQRLFKRYLSTSPSKYYMKIRLERARKLLQRTSLPVLEIGIMCGFTSASHFSKCYREQFATTPTGDRQPDSEF
ncbi:GlxA family transcriptional regulator [Dongia deserti]|uniref:GlxA family transcriptional regulator n=1 Tax=Dongia deserti TaxID=2268030 RepID=UPI000E64E022|nr:GlxA family transcriptional regulator [Dongia deserti]